METVLVLLGIVLLILAMGFTGFPGDFTSRRKGTIVKPPLPEPPKRRN